MTPPGLFGSLGPSLLAFTLHRPWSIDVNLSLNLHHAPSTAMSHPSPAHHKPRATSYATVLSITHHRKGANLPWFLTSLASLKSKYANLVDELDKTKTTLNEAKTGPILLRPCEPCSVLQKELDDAHARINLLEKSCSSSSQNALVECDVCPALLQELDVFKYALTDTKDENTHLRSVLGWVSAREPQLGMLLSQFK